MKKSTGTEYKSVFISDLHLGSKHCNSDLLLKFLDDLSTDNLYLVGDIIDGWRLKNKWFWPQKHNRIIQKLLKLSRTTNITYITGNHDEFLRKLPEATIGNVNIVNRVDYYGTDGKKFLVTHGDMFDNLMRSKSGRLVMRLGDIAYDLLLYVNMIVNYTRKILKLKNWSLAKFLKHKAKSAASFIGDFEIQLVEYCRNKGYNGIICGHIHHATIKQYDDITYMNDGDWCESCTALVETHQGEFKIISY